MDRRLRLRLFVMQTVVLTPSHATAWRDVPSRTVPWARTKFAALALATVLALGLRMSALSTYGLSEDELNKVDAIEQYREGHFGANAEHPMLMKLVMWASVDLAGAWNRIAPLDQELSLETALRLPNALAGAATTLVLFGIADLLFGGAVAAAVSLIWALDVNATAINRIGKEDTFLLLFFLLAVFFYERAKRVGVAEPEHAQRWYALSGASFGLMLASKYMPHYLGIYALFNVLTDSDPGQNRPNRFRHYGWMAAAFVIANVAVLMPGTWRYCASYVQGDMLAHHGYLYAGKLYVTNIPISPLGVPATYYLRLLATKLPLVLLAALVPGAIEMVRHHRERGFVLLRVLLVFVVVPYSLMAAKFMRYSLPMLATLDLVAAVGLVAGIRWLLRKQWLPPVTRLAVSSLALVVFVTGLVVAQQSAAPFYSLFQNGIGASLAAPGAVFPEETYDYGVREAVTAIAAAAGPSAVIVSDAPKVVEHYLQGSGRPDVRVSSLSEEGIPVGGREAWVLVQDEHSTFENRLLVERLRARERPWAQFHAGAALAVQVFRIAGR
jgi:4-amino-4-deoxy-L-arabinose transferase-like glycosyltransferase